ncbi:hypothetical protein [Dokdonella sp.]|uniref:hypothetical protein n=1 Tax=Dokdonella sp. TaxID=2291710 RepID=UPI003C66C502
MFSCIFAYATGAETQSASIELTEPGAALFLVRNDEHARAAMCAWLDAAQMGARSGTPNPASVLSQSTIDLSRAS